MRHSASVLPTDIRESRFHMYKCTVCIYCRFYLSYPTDVTLLGLYTYVTLSCMLYTNNGGKEGDV